MSKKEILLSVLLILMVIANVANIITMPRQSVVPEVTQEEFKNGLAELVENSDKPVLIDQYKVGDDARPKTVLVYAVKLPIKRFIGDDQIETFTVEVE